MEHTRGSQDPLSDVLISAVAKAQASVVRVAGRPGPPGSGTVLADDLILTAEHIVPVPDDAPIRISTADRRDIDARVVGRDPGTDIAVLRAAGAGLMPASASAAEPAPGSLGLIVARPGRAEMVSFGLVSGVAGPVRCPPRGILEQVIYVDAVMYPGFSGGALINTAGAVIGMVTSGLGIGGQTTAIPWSQAARIGRQL